MSETSDNELYFDWSGKTLLNRYILIKKISLLIFFSFFNSKGYTNIRTKKIRIKTIILLNWCYISF